MYPLGDWIERTQYDLIESEALGYSDEALASYQKKNQRPVDILLKASFTDDPEREQRKEGES